MATAGKILICDPDEAGRESLKLILGDYYNLILTDDGRQCLDCLARDRPVRLVFLDAAISADDSELTGTIKERYPQVEVVAVTGRNTMEAAGLAVRQGASGYIVKPLKSEEILAVAGKMRGHFGNSI